MNILVTGNLGYIGPELGKKIKNFYLKSKLIGLDSGLFLQCLTTSNRVGDSFYDKQIFMDIRDINEDILKKVDVVVSLAAVSNDPIGKDFEEATNQINFEANCKLADLCSKNGVQKFIFASSCSMYGDGGENAKKENDNINPLTAYAKSKSGVENFLKNSLVNKDLKCICLRFATACGISDRLRLDLVLNDFVASAIKYKKISILSDGSPLRPLIDVRDMANAILWAIQHDFGDDNLPISINVGSNDWNFNILELAQCVSEVIKGTSININRNAPSDKRSYKVDFSLYKSLSGDFYPNQNIYKSIDQLAKLISEINLPENDFRGSNYLRLNHLRNLIKLDTIDKLLKWK